MMHNNLLFDRVDCVPKNLFFYPGGKTRALHKIVPRIPNGVDICSPFIGGGSIELSLIRRGQRVRGYDVNRRVVNLWQQAIKNAEDVQKATQKYCPLTKEIFKDFVNNYDPNNDPVDNAARTFLQIQFSWGGMQLSHSDFNIEEQRGFKKGVQDRLKNFVANKLSVDLMSFEESIPLNKDSFIYADPPYLIKDGLYNEKDKGDLHLGFNHELLFDTLKDRGQWILSYNNCEGIRELYKDFKILEIEWTYTMSTKSVKDQGKELLIMSNDLNEVDN